MRYIYLIIALIFLGCSQKPSEEHKANLAKSVKPLKVGDVILLKGVEGGEKKLKRVKGGFELVGEGDKLLMIDFFGTFCPPCQKEAPNLTKLQIKNSDNLVLIGMTYYEDVTDKYVVENFSNKYGAHYFIANYKDSARVVKSVVEDISYPQSIQIPFKVLLKDGVYQTLTDVWYGKADTKFYIGDVGEAVIQSDLDKIIGK